MLSYFLANESESVTMNNHPEQFLTIQSTSETVLEIKRSRFICRAKHVTSVEEANQFIHEINRKNHDATHHCYAYIIDSSTQKSSDDGEPAGTAGRPILETLLQYSLLQSIVIITRYFGGIKLGAGGLVRAYREAAKLAIQSAGIVQKKLHQQVILEFDYSFFGKIEHYVQTSKLLHELPTFSNQVQWSVWVPTEQTNHFIPKMKDIAQGKIQIKLGKIRHKNVTS